MAIDKKKLVYIIGITIIILFLYYKNQPQQINILSSIGVAGSHGGKVALSSNIKFIAPNIFTATTFCIGSNCCGDYACAGQCKDCPGSSICCTQKDAYLSPDSCDGEPTCILPQRSYCKTSDPSWCCDDHSLKPCSDSADICGTSDWCNNWANGDKSCYGGNCCIVSGYIIDYACKDAGLSNCCCGPDNPFIGNNFQNCYIIPQPESRNWFTNQNICSPTDDPCSGINYNPCMLVNFIYQRQDKGPTVGQCGVECISESCIGLNSTICSPDYKKLNIGKIVGKCGVECLNDYCQGKDFIKCINNKNTNQGKVVGSCGVKCTKDYCDGKNYIQCVNYSNLNEGPTVAKCDVECLLDSAKDGYTCINNNWIKDSEISSYLNTTASNYYRFTEATDSCQLIKLNTNQITEYDYNNISNCELNIKPVLNTYVGGMNQTVINENKSIIEKLTPTPFDWAKARGILLIIAVVGLVAFFYLRRKNK